MSTTPQSIRVRADGALEVTWASDDTLVLPADQLRRACRCAACRRAVVDGIAVAIPPDLRIAFVEPVGVFGVNIGFSDGHSRGVYPYVYLRQIAGGPV